MSIVLYDFQKRRMLLKLVTYQCNPDYLCIQTFDPILTLRAITHCKRFYRHCTILLHPAVSHEHYSTGPPYCWKAEMSMFNMGTPFHVAELRRRSRNPIAAKWQSIVAYPIRRAAGCLERPGSGSCSPFEYFSVSTAGVTLPRLATYRVRFLRPTGLVHLATPWLFLYR